MQLRVFAPLNSTLCVISLYFLALRGPTPTPILAFWLESWAFSSPPCCAPSASGSFSHTKCQDDRKSKTKEAMGPLSPHPLLGACAARGSVTTMASLQISWGLGQRTENKQKPKTSPPRPLPRRNPISSSLDQTSRVSLEALSVYTW